MIKKFFIILCFFCVFLVNTPVVFSQEPPAAAEPQTEEVDDLNFIQRILKAIGDFFGFLIFGTNYISKPYDAPASYNTKEKTTDYTSEVNDYGSRAMPESERARRKGVYFYEVLFRHRQPYENRSIIDASNGEISCPHEISIKDIVCFYADKYNSGLTSEKILYERGSKDPTDYSRISGCSPLPNNDQCYLNAYQNYQEVPQGDFYNEEDTAAVASTQLNEGIRTFIPENRQGETAPDNNDTREKIDLLVKDSDKQEESMLLTLLPDGLHEKIGCDNDANIKRDNLRQTFKCNLTPYSQDNPECGLNGVTLDTSQKICIEDLHQKNGPGISQRGAHGMALVGFKYNEIITSYYTDKVSTAIIKGYDDQIIKVIMIDDTDFNSDGVSDNDANCSALVRNGQASNYNKADIKTGSGGVYSDGQPCVYETIPVPTSSEAEPDSRSETKYRVVPRTDLKEKYQNRCFGAITLDIHTYLLGIAEDPVSWHIEAQKAIIIAARGEVTDHVNSLGYVKNNSDVQVFQCNRVIQNNKENTTDPLKPKVTNQRAAVDLTRDELLVYKNTKKKISDSTHRSAFCGPGSNNPKFDGWEYETLSHLYDANIDKGHTINGICFEGVGYTLADSKDLGLSSDHSYLQNYQYNPNTQVLGQTNNQSSCVLDNRIFSSLDQLISAFNSQNSNNQLDFISCYRSTQQQQSLWDQYLSENKGDEFKTISQINYPGTSPHQTGRAIDFGDKFGKLTKNSTSYQWLVTNASKFNFYHHPLEPEHWEYKP